MMVLRDQPFCVFCQKMGRLTPSVVADHIIPVKQRPDLAYNVENLQGLCESCHSGIKARMERGRSRGFDVDGSPVGGW